MKPPKPDKLPSLDPNVRGIFDRIIATVAEVRKERRTEEWRMEEKRTGEAKAAKRELAARQAKEEYDRAQHERAKALTAIANGAYLMPHPDQPVLRLPMPRL